MHEFLSNKAGLATGHFVYDVMLGMINGDSANARPTAGVGVEYGNS